MTYLQEFGERVAQERREKAARERRDILQQDVAKAVGVSPQTYSRWEAGLNMPRDPELDRLAAFFGTTQGWLRYGQGPQRVEPGAGTLTIEGHSPTAVIIPPDLSQAVKLTEQDAARADVKAQRDRAERLARETKAAARAGRKRRPK